MNAFRLTARGRVGIGIAVDDITVSRAGPGPVGGQGEPALGFRTHRQQRVGKLQRNRIGARRPEPETSPAGYEFGPEGERMMPAHHCSRIGETRGARTIATRVECPRPKIPVKVSSASPVTLTTVRTGRFAGRHPHGPQSYSPPRLSRRRDPEVERARALLQTSRDDQKRLSVQSGSPEYVGPPALVDIARQNEQ